MNDALPTAIGLAAVVWWAMGLLKSIPAIVNAPEAARRALSAVVGIVVVIIYASTSWAEAVKIGADTLGSLSITEQILYGIIVGSGAGVLHDSTRALRG